MSARARPGLRPRADEATASDAALLSGVADGDLGALGELYDRHAVHVWRAVRRTLGDAGDVDDVVHATFLQLPRIARGYDGRASARGWLCGIGVRLAIRHRRGMARFRRMVASFGDSLAARPHRDPEAGLAASEEIAILDRALGALSDKTRAVFVLIVLEGLTSEEAGRALGIPAVTARTRLLQARQTLQAALAKGRGT